jgi:GNAT superfamily N-acetyltransferase
MEARRIDTSQHKEIRKFTEFPFELYQNCPQWVPPLESEMKLVMDRQRHPFYRHSSADFFIVEDGAQILGRIAVLHNRNYCEHHHQQTAFIYYYECIEDTEVSQALFKAAAGWAKERGLHSILGPKGFLRSNGLGLLVDGFEYTPAIGIPYNFSYYPNLWTDFGFTKVTDHLSGYITETHHPPEKMRLAAQKAKSRYGYWVKTFANKAEMRRWIPMVDIVHARAFQNNPGFYPSTPEEFALIAQNMITVADPQLIKLIMNAENEVIGFILAYADISKALQKTRGRIFPLGWITILNELRHARVCDLNGVGLLPEYQGMGANMLLYAELEDTLRKFNFEKAELIQIDERNFRSKSDMENMGVIWYKRHRTYELNLDSI